MMTQWPVSTMHGVSARNTHTFIHSDDDTQFDCYPFIHLFQSTLFHLLLENDSIG